MTEPQTRLIFVRCEPCSRRFGDGTRLGRMVLVNGRWGWNALERRRTWRGLPDRAIEGLAADLIFSGGVSARCRRCGSTPRASLKRLSELAESAAGHGGKSFLIG